MTRCRRRVLQCTNNGKLRCMNQNRRKWESFRLLPHAKGSGKAIDLVGAEEEAPPVEHAEAEDAAKHAP